MARKRNEEYIGDSDDGEFDEEPDFEDPEDFVDEVDEQGKNRKYVEHGQVRKKRHTLSYMP